MNHHGRETRSERLASHVAAIAVALLLTLLAVQVAVSLIGDARAGVLLGGAP